MTDQDTTDTPFADMTLEELRSFRDQLAAALDTELASARNDAWLTGRHPDDVDRILDRIAQSWMPDIQEVSEIIHIREAKAKSDIIRAMPGSVDLPLATSDPKDVDGWPIRPNKGIGNWRKP